MVSGCMHSLRAYDYSPIHTAVLKSWTSNLLMGSEIDDSIGRLWKLLEPAYHGLKTLKMTPNKSFLF